MSTQLLPDPDPDSTTDPDQDDSTTSADDSCGSGTSDAGSEDGTDEDDAPSGGDQDDAPSGNGVDQDDAPSEVGGGDADDATSQEGTDQDDESSFDSKPDVDDEPAGDDDSSSGSDDSSQEDSSGDQDDNSDQSTAESANDSDSGGDTSESDSNPNADQQALGDASGEADQNAGGTRVNETSASCDADDNPQVPPVTPVITIASKVVVVKRPYTNPSRKKVVLSVDDASFDGSGALTISSAAISFFDAATAGNAVNSGANFTGPQLGAGVTIFAEGTTPSAAVDDVVLTLTLTKGSKPVKPPATGKMTSVRVTLDICQSRTSKTTPPAPMSQGDKISVGRFLQVQDSNLCGRAMLIVRKAEPAAFAGNLVLIPLNGKVQAFDKGSEKPVGQAALPNRHVIANGTIDKAAGAEKWAEAANVSGALRDTGFQLGVDGVDDDGDRVVVTAVKFTNMKATIKSTPGIHGARVGAAAPADHTYQSNKISPDFATNLPLVLMRNGQPDVQLDVTSAPVSLPILWQAIRNTQDHASLGNAAAVPHVTPDADVTKAKLNTDSKGSFRVRAYIDCNGSNTYNDQVDLEPSIPLNLVLADATVVTDNSVAAGPFPATVGQAGGGVEIANGVWTFGSAGMNMELLADVTGGGSNGLSGLDCVFSGLVNNLTNVDISAVYVDSTVAPAANHSLKSIYVSNATAGTGTHRGRKLFKPGDPAPTPVAWPILDSGRSPAGLGGETATMSGSGPHTPSARPVGQRWKIQCMDAPSRGFPKIHPNFPNAVLSSIHLLWQFSANFCFWTNITKSRAATGDPADRLYSVLRIVNWQLAGDWTVTYPAPPAPNVANLTVVTQHAATTPSRSTVNPIGRAQDNNVEVRPPSGIAQIMAWDGSN